MEFTFLELQSLNKLLGRIKKEAYLDANEINFFAMSPFIISSIEKVHKAYMNEIRKQMESGKIPITNKRFLNPENDFVLVENSYVGDKCERLKKLDNNAHNYIKSLDEKGLEEFCDILFAPFIPTDNQKKEVLETLYKIKGI